MRTWWFYGLVLANGCGKAPPVDVTTPSAAPNTAPIVTQVDGMDELYGAWTFAIDPIGEGTDDPIYVGSVATFNADGTYTFELGESSFALSGRATLRESTGDDWVVDIDYGQERTTVYRITRRSPQAIVIREGETDPPASVRLYVRSE